MADEFGEKTEDPTPRKRQEAREQGKVARSRDLGTAVLIIASMVLLKNFGPGIVDALKGLVGDMLGPAAMAAPNAGAAVLATSRAVFAVGAALAPLLIGMLLAVVVVDLLQVGFVLNLKRLQPNMGAASPIKGVARLIGKGRSPVQGAISGAKLLLVGFVAYSAVHDRLPLILTAQRLEYQQIFGLGAEMVYAIGIRIGVALLVLAVIDYAFQRYRMEQELKMTKQEVKEEMRRMDGDPRVKQRRRQLAQQMMKEQLKRDVPTADVVVTNPTHYAVALKYDGEQLAPEVVAKGKDLIAFQIRRIAEENGVPVISDPPLARGLHKAVEIGHQIPEEFFQAVAQLLAFVYRVAGRKVV
jgi:flagellar biosynthesis protein FlhB